MAKFNPANFFGGPAYRWTRIQALFKGQPVVTTDDEVIRRTAKMLHAKRTAKIQRAFDDLHRARFIFESDKIEKWFLEALLLTQLSIPEIAQRVGTTPSIVEAYLSCFFDVRREDGTLKGNDWLLVHTIIHAMKGHDPYDPPEWVMWRYLAMMGGIYILEALYEDYLGLPAPDAAERSINAALGRVSFLTYCAPYNDKAATEKFLAHGEELIRLRDRFLEDPTMPQSDVFANLAAIQMRFDPQVIGEAPIYQMQSEPRLEQIQKPPKKKAKPKSKPTPKKKPKSKQRGLKESDFKRSPNPNKKGGSDARAEH